MSHYFDDTFTRHTNAKTPATPRSPSKPRLRRSSTARSLAARSDFSGDTNGDEDDEDDDAYTPRRSSVGNSIILNDPIRAREKADADAHMHNYISEQLERVRSQQGEDWMTPADEIEARPE
jgi:hypothetical protein